MSAPTAEELNALIEFRSRVRDLGLDASTDLSMLRWIRAREMNLEQAEAMLRKHMKWRQDENLAEILDWVPPDFISENYPYEITGRDSRGRPIDIIPFGNWDVRKALKQGMRDLFFRNIDQAFARIYMKMKETSEEFSWEVTQCILIFDFANFGLAQLISITGVNTLIEVVRRFESNYPEVVHKMYFVNAFRFFQMLLNIVKPFISPRTLSKIEIYTSPDQWIPVLRDNLPLDQFPIEFGGTQIGNQKYTGNDLATASIDAEDRTL